MSGAIATFDHAQFDAETLAATKAGRHMSVCLPALDEAATIGTIVSVIRHQLVEKVGLVDEIVVADDGPTDATAERAAAAVSPSSWPARCSAACSLISPACANLWPVRPPPRGACSKRCPSSRATGSRWAF